MCGIYGNKELADAEAAKQQFVQQCDGFVAFKFDAFVTLCGQRSTSPLPWGSVQTVREPPRRHRNSERVHFQGCVCATGDAVAVGVRPEGGCRDVDLYCQKRLHILNEWTWRSDSGSTLPVLISSCGMDMGGKAVMAA